MSAAVISTNVFDKSQKPPRRISIEKFLEKYRIRLSRDNINMIPPFVVEVISQFDPINTVTDKVIEYFNAGVKVVWHIFPNQKMVYVFNSIKNITVCTGDDICSADSVIFGYDISVNDIFQQR